MTWSPDDADLAVTACGPCPGDTGPGTEHLLVIPMDGSTAREVLNDAAEVSKASPQPSDTQILRSFDGATWSPDGRTIALAETACPLSSDPLSSDPLSSDPRADLGRVPLGGARLCTGRLLLVDVASGRQTPLATNASVPGAPSWSPDGSRLAFGQSSADGKAIGLFVIDRDGRNLTRLADGGDRPDWSPGSSPGWSPDGTWLEYARLNDLPGDIDRVDVWVVPAAGGEASESPSTRLPAGRLQPPRRKIRATLTRALRLQPGQHWEHRLSASIALEPVQLQIRQRVPGSYHPAQ